MADSKQSSNIPSEEGQTPSAPDLPIADGLLKAAALADYTKVKIASIPGLEQTLVHRRSIYHPKGLSEYI